MAATENKLTHAVRCNSPVASALGRAPLLLGPLFIAMPLMLTSLPSSGADWTVKPAVSVSETYTDNVGLRPSGQEQDDFITQVSPSVTVTGTGARIKASLNYSLQGLWYANSNRGSTFNHQLGAKGTAELVENSLYVDANASIRQQITSLFGPIGLDNTNTTNNLTDVRTWSVSPYLVHRFGTFASGQARYTHSAVSSGNSGLSNSSADGISLNLNSGTSFNDLSWGAQYSDTKTKYNSRPDLDQKTVSGTLGYRVTRKLHVSATSGYEKNSYLFQGSEPKGSFWNVGVGWAPTARTDIEASYGERFFGKTYGLSLSHHTRETSWKLGYSQDVTTSQAQLNFPAGVSTAEYLCVNQGLVAFYPDLATCIADAQSSLISLGLPLVLTDQFTLLTNRVFLNKRLDASVSVKRGKSTFLLSAFNTVRESLESGSLNSSLLGSSDFLSGDTIKTYGGNAAWNWHLTPITSSTVSLGWTRVRSVSQDLEVNRRTLRALVSRKMGPKMTGSLEYRHQETDSSQANSDSTENAVTARLVKTF